MPAEQVDNTLNCISEAQPDIEIDNQDMMQVTVDALQSEVTDTTTLVIDDNDDAQSSQPVSMTTSSPPPPPPPQLHAANDGSGDTDLPVTDTIEATSDSSSLPAIAEELPNGCSQDTKVGGEHELDAEMVSEDELPAPAQPTIDDAEDLSDDELPALKRAELPADTEVVSEDDEFPSSNKVKRKADESHEADNNPNESDDTPKKRAKTELDSKYFEF